MTDSEKYLKFLKKIEKEVDAWPPDKKTRRCTVFWKELNKKGDEDEKK